MAIAMSDLDLSATQFQRVKSLIYQVCGINLQPGKEGLVKARLNRRLSQLNLANFDHYLDYVESDTTKKELSTMVDSLTTNKTDFYREPHHFDFLHQQILPALVQAKQKMRFWCAACSSGEEPYSLSMQLHESLKQPEKYDVKILATDISSDILEEAQQAIYTQNDIRDLSDALVRKYFERTSKGTEDVYRIRENVQSLVSFARLNLMQPWPMNGPFDVIFCRNVMIYFDTPTRQKLVERMYHLLKPGGYLFIGHSESLTGIAGALRYVQPAVYVR